MPAKYVSRGIDLDNPSRAERFDRIGKAERDVSVVLPSGRSWVYTDTTPERALSASGESDMTLYTLGRVVQSEVNAGDPAIEALCVANATLNEARRKNTTVLRRITQLTSSDGVAYRGRFGQQSSRYCSTAARPSAWSLAVAELAMSHDFSCGADTWLDPRVWGKDGTQAGNKLSPLETVMESRRKDGYTEILVPGVRRSALILYGLRPKGCAGGESSPLAPTALGVRRILISIFAGALLAGIGASLS